MRLGYDFNEHWGTELRYAFGAIKLYDSERAMAVAPNSDVNPYETRYSDLDLVDASLVFYPWGDTRWRPYFLTGIGLTQLRFQDILGVRYSVTVPDIPLGVGLKFHVSEAAALRVELNDTIVFSGGLGLQRGAGSFAHRRLGVPFRRRPAFVLAVESGPVELVNAKFYGRTNQVLTVGSVWKNFKRSLPTFSCPAECSGPRDRSRRKIPDIVGSEDR